MTKDRLVEKTRKLLEKWGVKGEEADKFIADLEAEDEEVVEEEVETEEIDTPETEEEKVEDKEVVEETEDADTEATEDVVEKETPTESIEEETEELEEEVKEDTEDAEEAKEEVIEHEEGDKDKWANTEAKFTALDGEIAELKAIINELRDRVEGGAFGTTGKLPPQEDDEWEGSHTKAYFRNKRF